MVFNASAGGGGIAASSVTMTGGTLSGSGLDWYYGNSYNPTLYTLASSAHSTISANVNLRLNAATNNLTFNVAQGTTSDGVDLLVTGNITAGGSASGNGGGIIKTGSGVMVLAGSNSYNGATTVSGGTLELENTSANANTFAAGNININNGATLRVAYTNENQYWFDGNTFTFDSNGGGVIDTTNSSLNFVNGSPGDTFVTTGGSRDAMIGSSGLNLNGYTATFNIARGTDPTADMTVSYLSNSGNILKTGSGILALVGASMAYTGSTTVNAGMLVINATAATGDNFGNSSGFTIASGGTLQLLSNCTGYHRWVPGTVQITGAGTFLRTGSASIFFANGTSAVTFNQSAGGLADFEGGLTSYMETTTTNSGGLTINSGTAGIQGSAYFDALNGNNGGVLYVNQNAGTLYLGVAGGSGAFAGQIESGQALVKQGAGLQVLSGANTYSGGTTISGGTLQYGVNNSLPTSGAVHVSGGTLDLNTFNGTVGAVTMVNGAITGNSGATLTGASYAVQNGMISANLAGASATLTKSTTGIVLLSGSNSYGGGTIINNSGILQLGNPAALGTGSLVANGGTLDLAGYSVAVSSFSGAAGTVTNNGGTVATLTVNQAGNTVFGGSINDGASSMALNLTGSGTLTLTNSNAYSGPTTIAGGVLYAGVAGALSSSSAVTISGGTLDASNSLQAILSLTMTGANPALILSATNPLTSSSSGTATFAGTLNVLNYTTGSVAELMTYGAHTGTFTTVDVNGVAMPATDELLYQPTYLEILPSGPPTWASASSGSWTTPTNWIGTLPGTAAGQKAIINAPTIQQVTITLDSPQTLGALTLGNSQSSTSGYTLATGIAGSLTMATSDGSAAVITVTDGSHVIQANVVLAGSLTIAPSTGSTLEIDGNMSESLSGSGSLLLADAGTLILGGTNSFTGGTVVETGTLILTNNAALAEGSSLTIGDAAAFSAEELRVEGRESSGTPTLNSQLSTLNSPLAASPSITPVPEPGTLLLLLAFGLWSAVTCHRFSRRRKVGS